MNPEQLQVYFNICPNGGALPRILGEKLTQEEYDLLCERIQMAIELAISTERARCLAALDGLYHGDTCRAAIRALD